MDLEIIICCCCLVLIYLKPGLIFHLWQDVSHSEEQDKNANLSSSDIIQVVTLEKVSLIDVSDQNRVHWLQKTTQESAQQLSVLRDFFLLERVNER